MPIQPIINAYPNDPNADTLYVTGNKSNENNTFMEGEINQEISDRISADSTIEANINAKLSSLVSGDSVTIYDVQLNDHEHLKIKVIVGYNSSFTLTGGAIGTGTSPSPIPVAVQDYLHNHITSNISNLNLDVKLPIAQSSYNQAVDAEEQYQYTMDYSLGDMQRLTVLGNVKMKTPINFPLNKACQFVLEIVNGGNYSVSWNSIFSFENGIAPVLTPNGIDRLIIVKNKNGEYTVYVGQLNASIL